MRSDFADENEQRQSETRKYNEICDDDEDADDDVDYDGTETVNKRSDEKNHRIRCDDDKSEKWRNRESSIWLLATYERENMGKSY